MFRPGGEWSCSQHAGASLLLQRLEGQAQLLTGLGRTCAPEQAADRISDVGVETGFIWVGRDPDCSARLRGSSTPHVSRLLRIMMSRIRALRSAVFFGFSLLPRVMLCGEVASCFQLARADQSDHVEQFGKVVLHRRCSQKEYSSERC